MGTVGVDGGVKASCWARRREGSVIPAGRVASACGVGKTAGVGATAIGSWIGACWLERRLIRRLGSALRVPLVGAGGVLRGW